MSQAAEREGGDGPEEGEASVKVAVTRSHQHACFCVTILTQINQTMVQPARLRFSKGMALSRIYNVRGELCIYFAVIFACVCVFVFRLVHLIHLGRC